MSTSTHTPATDVRPGKRDRLIQAGGRCLHHQGVLGTTIADIAHAADVPPGNVHYYFKTRDDIVAAVIDAQNEATRQRLKLHDRRRKPAARLKSLITEICQYSDDIALYGCPIGTLCTDLGKLDDDLARRAAISLHLMVDWAEEQFSAMGQTDARLLAVELIGRYEGAAVLTNSFRDPTLMRQQERRMKTWIDSLVLTQ